MPQKFYLTILLLIVSIVFLGCTPSSYNLRFKTNSGLTTHEDSVRVGLAKEDIDNLIYYPQDQDTLINFDEYDDEEEENGISENELNISEILNRLNSPIDPADSTISYSSQRDRILIEIIKYMDTPYKFGGNSKTGIDCSAFTQNVFSCLGINLFRSAREQYTQGIFIKEKNDLAFGDLVFFNTRRRVKPGHVGIYLGDNLFAHASSKKGVIISSMEHSYYSKRYMGGRRIDEVFSQN